MLSFYFVREKLFHICICCAQSFDDLHKLWYVLYKERNLLLTAKQKYRRTQRPVSAFEEFRYKKVKRSMAGIKHVLAERKKIDKLVGVSSSIPKTPSTYPPREKKEKIGILVDNELNAIKTRKW